MVWMSNCSTLINITVKWIYIRHKPLLYKPYRVQTTSNTEDAENQKPYTLSNAKKGKTIVKQRVSKKNAFTAAFTAYIYYITYKFTVQVGRFGQPG